MIGTIVFDLGGVVVFESQDLWKSVFLELSSKFKINLKTLESHLEKYKAGIQTGRINLYDFYTVVLGSIRRNDTKPEELLRIHLKSHSRYSAKCDRNMLELIGRLRKCYQVVCFTNTEPEVAELNRRNGLFDYFERAFISSEMGLRKPDPKSYKKVLDELYIKPQQAVFIDNDPNNVEAAKRIGINGIVYRDVSHLKRELASLGVDIYP
jgi:HAD superfamily hydrolase (TIGR01509 family)